MAGFTSYIETVFSGACCNGSIPEHDFPLIFIRHKVDTKNGFHFLPGCPGSEQLIRPGSRFLGWLEYEYNIMGESPSILSHPAPLYKEHQGGGMTVMSTCMHPVVSLASEFHIVFFMDGQCINISPEGKCAVWIPIQICNDPCLQGTF